MFIFVCFNEFQEETLCAQTPTAPRCTESEITNQGVEDLTAQQSAGSADWMRVRHTPLRRAAHASAGLLSAKSLHLRLRGGVMLSCAGRYTTMSMWLALVHVGCGREAKTRCKGSVREMKRLSAMNTIENKNVNHIYIRHATSKV